MKLRLILPVLTLLVLAFALPVMAQDTADETHDIAYNGFSFSAPHELGSVTLIREMEGDPIDAEVPGGALPPQVVISLFPELPEAGMDFAPHNVRVFNTADLQQYELANIELADLQTLLATDVDLVQYAQISADGMVQELPYLNPIAAAQTIIGRPKYIDGNGLRGIAYVTAFRQDVYPFLADSFVYTFNGVSDDGQRAVNASFTLTTDLFEAEVPEDFDYEAFSGEYIPYLNETRDALNSASPANFTPNLDTLDQVIASFSFTGAVDGGGSGNTTDGGAQTAPEAVEPTPIVDATFGGLGNTTWTLAEFGDPNALAPRLPESEVTITFSERGVTGNAGCNTFGGEFSYADSTTISISNIIATRMACDGPIQEQENAFLAALQNVTGYAVDERGSLTLFYTENEVQKQLNFRSAEALAATEEAAQPTPEVTPAEATPEVTPEA